MIHIATIKSTRYYENFDRETNRESLQNTPEANMQETQPPAPQEALQNVSNAPADIGVTPTLNTAQSTFAPEDSSGQIVVQVRTASGTQPVTEAVVIIYKNNDGKNQIVSFSSTNEDGTTPVLSLPAPKKADAQAPSDSMPFSDYRVTVQHPMFYTAVLNNVQIFGGELTIQTVELIPLPELTNERDTTKTVNIPKQNL